jgi:hypothetical protein
LGGLQRSAKQNLKHCCLENHAAHQISSMAAL